MITPERVCKVLEGLCMLDLDTTDEGRKAFTNMTYRWCHIARGECKNPHKDWEQEFLDTEKEVLDALKSPAEKREK